MLLRRKLAPPPYDGSKKPCIDVGRVRSFTSAPETATGPVTFAIIGDLGQFEHSQETLEHMRDHSEGINAVVTALIPKAKGGLRPFGLFSGIYRLWARARRSEVADWERTHDRAYFSAREGKGA